VQEGEWQYARQPSLRDAISYVPENYFPLVQSGQMTLVKGDQEIVPGISVKVFPGHTAHMQAVVVTSGGQTACYVSDLIPTTAHIDLVWGMAFDLFPLQTIESKKQYYAQSVRGRWLTVFTHDPKTPWAYVEGDGLGKMVVKGV
jgi:glyoxylase-like metal-dependent hydrolase (beta-lactamase superfamily II)